MPMNQGYSILDPDGYIRIVTEDGNERKTAMRELTPEIATLYPMKEVEKPIESATMTFRPDVLPPKPEERYFQAGDIAGLQPTGQMRAFQHQEKYGYSDLAIPYEETPESKAKKAYANIGKPVEEKEVQAKSGIGGFDDFDNYRKQMMEGTKRYYDEMGRASDRVAAEYQGMTKALTAHDEENARLEQQKMDMINERQQLFDMAVSDYKDMSVSKANFWKSQSAGQKALAGISLALGAVGSAMTGKENHAMNIIKQAVDEDLELQQQAINKKSGELSAGRSLLGDMYDRFKDERQARLAARAIKIDDVMNKVKTIEMQSQSAQLKAKAQSTLGELGLEFEKTKADLMKTFAEVAHLQGAGGLDKELLIPMPDGSFQMALTKDDAKKTKEAVETNLNYQRNLDRLIELREKNVGKVWKQVASDDKFEAEQLSKQLFTQGRTLFGLGILSEGDMELLKSMYPSNIFTGIGFARKYQTLKDVANNNLKNTFVTKGLKPITGFNDMLYTRENK